MSSDDRCPQTHITSVTVAVVIKEKKKRERKKDVFDPLKRNVRVNCCVRRGWWSCGHTKTMVQCCGISFFSPRQLYPRRSAVWLLPVTSAARRRCSDNYNFDFSHLRYGGDEGKHGLLVGRRTHRFSIRLPRPFVYTRPSGQVLFESVPPVRRDLAAFHHRRQHHDNGEHVTSDFSGKEKRNLIQ